MTPSHSQNSPARVVPDWYCRPRRLQACAHSVSVLTTCLHSVSVLTTCFTFSLCPNHLFTFSLARFSRVQLSIPALAGSVCANCGDWWSAQFFPTNSGRCQKVSRQSISTMLSAICPCSRQDPNIVVVILLFHLLFLLLVSNHGA